MRFRSLFHLPSFGGYCRGFNFAKTLAYGLAADLDEEFYGAQRRLERSRRRALNVQIDYVLMRDGILPWPGQKKREQAKQPREVIEPRTVCAPAWQPYPAACKENGGLRGSKATKWRR